MKKLLVIVTAFAPENAIGSIRTTKLVKYLVRMDWKITVISPKLPDLVKKDETLQCQELGSVNHIIIPYGKFFSRFLYKKRNEIIAKGSGKTLRISENVTLLSKLKNFVLKRVQFIYTIARNYSWEKQVVHYLQRHFAKKEFDYVFSSYPSSSSHMAAMFAFEKRIAKKWVADFRDLMSYESLHSKMEQKLFDRLQGMICKKASVITAVSKGLVEKLSVKYNVSDKCFFLPNGFDQDDLKNINDFQSSRSFSTRDELIMVYAGSLYGGKRDLSPLFSALRGMEQDGSICIEKLRFLYAGRDFETLQHQAEPFGMGRILLDYGYVERSVSLGLQKLADIVIVCTWNTDNEQGIMTGKIFECFLLKKPVIVLVNGTKPGGELSEMVQRSKLGFIFNSMISNPTQHKGLQSFVLRQMRVVPDKQSVALHGDNEFIESFDYANIAWKLTEIMENKTSNLPFEKTTKTDQTISFNKGGPQ